MPIVVSNFYASCLSDWKSERQNIDVWSWWFLKIVFNLSPLSFLSFLYTLCIFLQTFHWDSNYISQSTFNFMTLSWSPLGFVAIAANFCSKLSVMHVTWRHLSKCGIFVTLTDQLENGRILKIWLVGVSVDNLGFTFRTVSDVDKWASMDVDNSFSCQLSFCPKQTSIALSTSNIMI